MEHFKFKLSYETTGAAADCYPTEIRIYFYDDWKARVTQFYDGTHIDSWYPNHQKALDNLEAWLADNNYILFTAYDY